MSKKIETQCPKDVCNNNGPHVVLYWNDGSDNVDNKAHYHVKCRSCNQEFNVWGHDKHFKIIDTDS